MLYQKQTKPIIITDSISDILHMFNLLLTTGQMGEKRNICSDTSNVSVCMAFKRIPASETSEVFDFNSVPNHARGLYVCLEHLTADCFINETQCNGDLLLKDEAGSCIGSDYNHLRGKPKVNNLIILCL